MKKKVLLAIVLVVVLLGAGLGYAYFATDALKSDKQLFFSYLLSDDFTKDLKDTNLEKYVEKQVIEIAPLAFMRGRTLNDAVVILDEAQNATCAQMKMFLTRMGKNCKMVVTGDVTQIDLIKKKDSGLMQACTILDHIDGISIIHLENSDVVRNPLVQKIIERYAKVE